MALPFFMPDGSSQKRTNTVPAYLSPTKKVGTTTAGEDNRFRNQRNAQRPAQQTATTTATPPNPYASSAPDYLRVIAEQTASAKQPATKTKPNGPVQVTPAESPVVSETEPEFSLGPVNFVVDEEPAPEATPYSVYDDPFYQQALASAQSRFNLDRIDALAGKQYQELPIQRQLDLRPQQAEAARRRLAGNYAARGMAGGRAGVLSRAEAEANAREIASRTSLREQIAELNRQFTSQFGAEGTDWLGTRRGMEAQQAAIQAALQNRLAGLTTVG